MDEPSELSLKEIHKYFVRNNYKVTNTQLVKYFRKFLTGNRVEEARKQFKTFVNTLATIKNENNEKYLILRKKYYDEVPLDDTNMSLVSSTSMMSLPSSEYSDSPVRNIQPLPPPPVYREPPRIISHHASSSSSLPTSPMHQFPSLHQQQQHVPIPISMTTVGLPVLEPQTRETYKECVNEFQQVMSDFMGTSSSSSNKVDVASRKNSFEQIIEDQAPSLPPRKKIDHRSLSRECSVEKQMQPSPSFEKDENKENVQSSIAPDNEENKSVSVREAMLKFNKFAAEEEAKVPSPISKLVKSKTEKLDDTGSSESLTSHPKAKEWMISAARANYQELAKLGHEFPCLVRLQDPNTGYTALHWASKHGNLNCVKLIAGTFKCDPNIQTNGGYTSLHIAMQFSRNDVFEILCNVYKADRDILDWSGKKPLDYQKQLTSISASTFSKIKSRKKISAEKDQSNSFLRIGSLRIGNLLGVQKQNHHNSLNQRITISQPSSLALKNTHYGSVDNVTMPEIMGPPKHSSVKKRKQKRENSDYSLQTQSMPTTPNLENRHKSSDIDGSDSDTAYGFHDNWGGA